MKRTTILAALIAAIPAVAAHGQVIELGRCVKVPRGSGVYTHNPRGECSLPPHGAAHDREWLPGALDGRYTSDWYPRPNKPPIPNPVAPSWELRDGRKLVCEGARGVGNHVSPTEDRLSVTFIGCEWQGVPCADATSAELSLSYEPIGPNYHNWGTVFAPSVQPFMAFDCGLTHFAIEGSAVAQTPNNPMSTEWIRVKFNRGHGKQNDQAHARTGTPYRGFTAKITGAGVNETQSVALEAAYYVTNEEPLRIRISSRAS